MIRIKPEPKRAPVTKALKDIVTKLCAPLSVTKSGRPRKHASGAAKQNGQIATRWANQFLPGRDLVRLEGFKK